MKPGDRPKPPLLSVADLPEWLEELLGGVPDTDVVRLDGLDDAIVGLTIRHTSGCALLYDLDKIVEILMKRDGMTKEDAEEFADFNILCAWFGEATPSFLISKRKML